MKCVKVKLKQAENAKRRLIKFGVLSNDFSVKRNKDHVYFPIIKNVTGFEVVEKELERKEGKTDFLGLLRNKLSEKEFSLVKKSYDVIGNIAILEIDRNLLNKRRIIAGTLLKTNRSIETVVRKVGGHKGKYRIQKYEILAGKKSLETLYKENGIVIRLDISKVYFSPRLSNERLRIAKIVRDNESVLVIGSGVSPYELNITKHSKANEIYGIEINKNACRYAEENVKLNKTKRIKLFCGDVKKVLTKLNKKFDRIVMPLPKDSAKYLDIALKFLNKNSMVHFYCFIEEDKINKIVDFIKARAKIKIINIVKCGQQSPRVYRYCIDFKII